MREHTALVKSFDSDGEELVLDYGKNALDTFIIPERNWNGLIEDYNSINKKKFKFTPLQCKIIIQHVKQSIPPKRIFRAMGVSFARYEMMAQEAQEYEEKFQELLDREVLTEDETDLFHILLRNPLRILMEDVGRAEGISEIMDWEEFNKNVEKYPEVQLVKMKARFKDFFNEKESQGNTAAVQIILGGDFISNL